MDVEKIATASVTTSISATDVLSPFVNDGDKEPSWDGNIYIYSDKKKKKDGIRKVPIQVKGKQWDDFSKETIKYPVSVVDLENYLGNGGVVFFVVYINNTGTETKIYYSCLLPIKIRIILEEAKGKRKPSIEFKSFPENNLRKVSIFLNFYDHMQKQTSFAHAELQSLNELDKQGILEGISFSVTGYADSNINPYKLLYQDDIYMYANIRGSAIPQPLKDIPMDLYMSEKVKAEISVNGVVYYSQFQRCRSKDGKSLTIGKSVSIRIMESKHCITIKITPTDILKYSVTDLEFILELQKYNQFEIDGHIIPFDSSKILNEKMVERLQQNLEFCKNLIRVLEVFKLDTEIDLSKLSAEDDRNNARFIKSILKNEPVSGLKDDLPFVVRLNYLGTKVIIGLKKEDQSGTYRISDYFSQSPILYYKDNRGVHRTSKYDFLEEDDFLVIRNIDYDDLLLSYQELAEEENIYDRANSMLLKLLLAYDKSGDKRKDILNTAYKFAKWLYDENTGENNLESVIRKLNLYQVLKRLGNLTKEQKKELFCLADDTNQENEIRVGSYLLLDNQIAAETLFDRLDDDQKEMFSQCPIFRYWKENVED